MFPATERKYSVTVSVESCFLVGMCVNVPVMMVLASRKSRLFMDVDSLVVRSESSVSIPVKLLVILVSHVHQFLVCSMWLFTVLVVDVARRKSV